MKKNRINFWLQGANRILLVLLFLVTTEVSASRVAYDTQATCNVAGVITSVELQEAYEDPCMIDPSGCPLGAVQLSTPAKYNIGVLLESLSCTQGESDPVESYESTFNQNEVNLFTIPVSAVPDGTDLQIKKNISGTVAYPHEFTSFQTYSKKRRTPVSNNNLEQPLPAELTPKVIPSEAGEYPLLREEITGEIPLEAQITHSRRYSLLPMIMLIKILF